MFFLVFTFTVSLSLFCQNVQGNTVKVSIYYEALCIDSERFIINELASAYPIIKERVELDFVPYGKATQQWQNGKWHFSCQHGFNECAANKFQACGLNQQASQDTNLKFVTCIMKSSVRSRYNPVKVLECADESTLKSANLSECAQSSAGDNILAAYGTRTLSLNPTLTFVPTIIFNDKYDSFLQNDALEDFLGTVCLLLDEPKPEACAKKRQNTSSWKF